MLGVLRYVLDGRGRAQERRRAEWARLDGSDRYHWIWTNMDRLPHYRPLREMRREAMEDYAVNGGDLPELHRRASVMMSRQLMAMGTLPAVNQPYALNHDLYERLPMAMRHEWHARGRHWHARGDEDLRQRLRRLRAHEPGTREYEAARRFDRSFINFLATRGDIDEHYEAAIDRLATDTLQFPVPPPAPLPEVIPLPRGRIARLPRERDTIIHL